MPKRGRPRGRPRKIMPEVASKKGRKKKQVETVDQRLITKQKEQFVKLKQELPEICLKPTAPSSSSEQPKKFGKIPISKFRPTVLEITAPKLPVNDSQVPPFQPLTPPASDVSRSCSEVSAVSSVSPTIVLPPESIVPVSRFHLINAWLARKQSSWCVKNSDCLKKMINKESLVSTFKCMAKACSYTTISRKNFKTHIQCHESTSNQLQYLYFCPYCFFKGSGVENLLHHYTTYHNHDCFQCGSCFYRSADAHSCWEHCTAMHHPHLPPIIYECPLEPAPNNEKTKLRLKNKRRQFVLPLQCTSCSLQFYLMDQYEAHFSQHIDISETVINDLRMYRSKIVNSQLGRFECLFCDYGTNQRGEIFIISIT